MKTDLTKILSVSGQRGLFLYLAQARNGVVVEALSDKRRTVFDAKSRVTTLADISIFTTEGELKLQDALLKLKEVLGDREAPSAKASSEEVKELFAKAVPNYDPDRFYASHMKKILDWYAELKQYASFDFVDPDQEKEAEENGGEAVE
ncbi:MAG: DUF5606 domain-containing protein [Candidatus Cryptobacteroides sp.]|jgi:hypothetical protein|nr:DUF5606 domain-containing protein [Bacteroidales bacterium]